MKWIICAFIFSQLALAESFHPTTQQSCSSLDLRTEKLKEIRDQKKVAWCYAFTAADMLTHVYDLPEKVSAADVAINYNDSDLGQLSRWLFRTFGRKPSQSDQDNFMMPHQTGFNKVALDRVMRDGYCPERVFPSESWVRMQRDGDKWLESKTDLRSAMLEIYQLLKNQQGLTVANLPFYYHFKNIETPEEFYRLIKGQTASDFYSKLRKEVCKYDRIKFQDRFKTLMYIKDALAFGVLNKQLDLGRVIGIDYDSRLLTDARNGSVSLAELHTSSIVARRWNQESQQCQYLVRDSYGKQCSKYDVSYECLGGQVWIDEAQIYTNLVSFVTVIK
jgi:hypothetical protein